MWNAVSHRCLLGEGEEGEELTWEFEVCSKSTSESLAAKRSCVWFY